jgi:hypothetical protein
VFGKVRMTASANTKQKLKVERYLEKFGQA